MKNTIYTTLILLLFSFSTTIIQAQTLNPGDIAIIEYQSDGSIDRYAFVALVDIQPGTKIYFTDRSYDGTSFPLPFASEGTQEWTSPATVVPCGTVITYNGSVVNNFDIGSYSLGIGSFDLDNAGDELIAYQAPSGFVAPTTFLYALNFRGGATWGAVGGSFVPPGLTDGFTALLIDPHRDNGRYDGPNFNDSQTNLLTAISDDANWFTANAINTALYAGPNPMTVTSCGAGCPHTVTAYTPASGPEATIVTINGTGFTGSSTVDFNGTPAATVIFVNSTTLVAIVPAGATSGNINVTEGGCPAAGPSFTVITQTGACGTPPIINAEPSDVNTCPFVMNVAASPGAGGRLSYQWKFNDGIAPGWSDVNTVNLPGITVAGETTDNLSLGSDLTSINGYQFYCEVTEAGCMVASNAAQLNFEDRFYRSTANGNWSNVVKWEAAPAAIGPWAPACACPNAANSDYIHISSGNNINVNQNITADQLVVEAGATLNINTNRLLTITNNTGVDLDVQGTLVDNGTAGNGIDLSSNNATWLLGINGEIIKTRNSAVLQYRDNYQTGINNIPETATWRYRYTGAGTVSVATVGMFYPNLFFESSDPLGHDFSAAAEIFAGNSDFMTVKGNFSVGATDLGHVIIHNTNTHATPILVLGNLIVGGNGSANRSIFANNFGTNIGTGIQINGDLILNSNGGLDFDDGIAATPDGIIQLSGNWNNLATEADFEQGESTVSFEGGNIQTISIPIGFERFHNLQINKSSNTLNPLSNVHVENSVLFTNGIINNNFGNTFLFEVNASASSASNASHIDGPIQKATTAAFTQNFTFPTGDNGILGPIGIETRPGVLDNDIFTAQYFAVAAPNPTQIAAPLNHVSAVEYWTLEEGDANNDSDCKVTLFWGPHSTVNSVVDIRVAHYKASNLWEMEGDIPTIVHAGTTASGTVTSDWVTSFSPFTLGDISTTGLPLYLLTFEAVKIENSSKISWSVDNEMMGDFYELEHSIDANNFEPIYSISAIQNQSTAYYNYLHNFPVLGENYYRLKQTDAAGLVSYGPIKSLNFDKLSTEVSIFPNPAHSEFTVLLPGTLAESVQIEVVDVLGSVIFETMAQKGIKTMTIDSRAWPAGTYFLRWGNESRTYITEKFVVRH